MRTQELEPEVETLLARLQPSLSQKWKGATPDQITQIERLAGRPLPRFYRWFLERMGLDMGPIAYPSLDFSAAKVLSCYDEGQVPPNSRLLLIGYESNDEMPLHIFYDFEHPAREDARIIKRHFLGGPIHNQFDSFREMICWGEFVTSRIDRLSQRCEGSFEFGSNSTERLDAVMARLGFTKPIQTGRHCVLYERTDAAMAIQATPRDPPSLLQFFDFASSDKKTLRFLLGTITRETSIDFEIGSWTPPLRSQLLR